MEVRSPALQERGRSVEQRPGLAMAPPSTGRSLQEAGLITGPVRRLQLNATGSLLSAWRLPRCLYSGIVLLRLLGGEGIILGGEEERLIMGGGGEGVALGIMVVRGGEGVSSGIMVVAGAGASEEEKGESD